MKHPVLFSAMIVFAALCAGSNAQTFGPEEVYLEEMVPHEQLVPAEKNLSEEWIESLYERGEPNWLDRQGFSSLGMPCGGIAAGQIYLRGDGTLGQWWNMNNARGQGTGKYLYRHNRPQRNVQQGFALVVEGPEGARQVRRLDEIDFPAVKGLFEHPIGQVVYEAEDYPLRAEMEAFSPFIPLNEKDSALPATLFHITVTNTSDQPVRLNMLSWLENAVCPVNAEFCGAYRKSTTRQDGGRTYIEHRLADPPREEARKEILIEDFEGPTFEGWTAERYKKRVDGKETDELDDVHAFGAGPVVGELEKQPPIKGIEGSKLLNGLHGGMAARGILRSKEFEIDRRMISALLGGQGGPFVDLYVEGKRVRRWVAPRTTELQWHDWNVGDFIGKKAYIEINDPYPNSYILVDHIVMSDEPKQDYERFPDVGTLALVQSEPAGKVEQTAVAAEVLEGVPVAVDAGNEAFYPVTEKQAQAMSTPTIELGPGEEKRYTYVVAWHFPKFGQVGRQYAQWFDSATDAADYVLDNEKRLTEETRLWHQTFYEDSTLPRWLLFRLHSTVSTLATETCQWWNNGRFWAFEGVCCCAGTCTHVWNYQHVTGRLFPALARSTREMQDFGAGMGGNGVVGFRGGRRPAMDGQCGTVLKAYREHLMSPDNGFLQRNWPNIKKVMQYSIEQDAADGDHQGKPDGILKGQQHNTYDVDFYGPNTFVGSLYLASLRAAEEMAIEMDDPQFARQCREIFESGKAWTAENLWNGEYYFQIPNWEKTTWRQYENGCLSDQVFGQGWAHQVDLGYIYPREQIVQALESVWKYNYTTDIGPYNKEYRPFRDFISPGEAGVILCTWPHPPRLKDGVSYKNEVWTGIEYQVAGHMVWEGMIDKAMVICRAVQDRYDPQHHNPFNEVECGYHYARGMASWGVFTALCGFEYHGPKGHIGFDPRITPEDFRAAFTSAEGWGSFTQQRKEGEQIDRLEVRYGRLRVRTLRFALEDGVGEANVTVALDGEKLPATGVVEDGGILVTLESPAEVSAGQSLEVRVQTTR